MPQYSDFISLRQRSLARAVVAMGRADFGSGDGPHLVKELWGSDRAATFRKWSSGVTLKTRMSPFRAASTISSLTSVTNFVETAGASDFMSTLSPYSAGSDLLSRGLQLSLTVMVPFQSQVSLRPLPILLSFRRTRQFRLSSPRLQMCFCGQTNSPSSQYPRAFSFTALRPLKEWSRTSSVQAPVHLLSAAHFTGCQ